MLGLADQVGGDHHRVGAVVGNHGRFGRAGHHVDAHPAKQHALGLGHEAVAGPDDDVGRVAAETAVGQRRDGLHAPQRQHRVRAAQLHCVEDARVHAMVAGGGRGGDDVPDTGHLGRAHAHDRAGGMGVAPARHIASRGVAGDQALADLQAGQQFGPELMQRIALALGEILHAVTGKADVRLNAGREGFLGGRKVGLAEHDVAGVAVEIAGIAPHGVFAAGLDLGQHPGHRLGRGRVDGRLRRVGALEVGGGQGTPFRGQGWRPQDSRPEGKACDADRCRTIAMAKRRGSVQIS